MADQDDIKPPKVTGSPEAIWLVYGDIEHDDTHANCCASGEVTWCEDGQFASDVRYVRADTIERLAAELEEARRVPRVESEGYQERLQQVRKNAARYEWLRSVPGGHEAARIVNDTPHGMDAAIDAAMSTQAGEKGGE